LREHRCSIGYTELSLNWGTPGFEKRPFTDYIGTDRDSTFIGEFGRASQASLVTVAGNYMNDNFIGCIRQMPGSALLLNGLP